MPCNFPERMHAGGTGLKIPYKSTLLPVSMKESLPIAWNTSSNKLSRNATLAAKEQSLAASASGSNSQNWGCLPKKNPCWDWGLKVTGIYPAKRSQRFCDSAIFSSNFQFLALLHFAVETNWFNPKLLQIKLRLVLVSQMQLAKYYILNMNLS